MTICYKGNDCKYETEAVMKLFLPVVTFDFRFEEDPPDGDFALIFREVTDEGQFLSVSVSYNGKREEKSELIPHDGDYEHALCRMLFLIMSSLTGITPEWGCLTGIRPVKKVNALLEKGLSKDEIFRRLKEEYFVSDRKLELAYNTAVTQKEYFSSLKRNSYSLYVSIPFCPSRCAYCSFVSHSIESPGAKKLLPEYVEKLCEEISLTAEMARDIGLKADTIYIGGGTPTSLSPEELEILMKNIAKSFDISKIREYTVEAGRPDTITEKKLEVIREYGASRISVNPQTMNDEVLRAIGRRHTAADTVSAFETARRMGFDNINMDTIAGLPCDTPESFSETIKTLCSLAPESITLHTLTLKRSSALFSGKSMPPESRVSEAVDAGQEILLSNGYLPYYLYRQKNTVDNLENTGFAKKGKECLYNIYIMEETQTILAAGAGASAKLVDPVSDRIERVFNYKFPYEYISRYPGIIKKKENIRDFFRRFPVC